jgi:hypothetical protein
MKLKQSPDDFQVEEVTALAPGVEGPHAFYRMDKSGWSTPDALSAIRRRWKIDLRRLSYGGLKDRHARTSQFLSIFNGPRRGLNHHTITLTYLGQIPRPYASDDISANKFRITLRDIAPARRPEADERLAALPLVGVPNYFDDQRFGSVPGPGAEFIARLLVKASSRTPSSSPSRATTPTTTPPPAPRRRHSPGCGATGPPPRTRCRAATPAAWSITSGYTPPISKVPSPASAPSCAACTSPPTSRTCGTESWPGGWSVTLATPGRSSSNSAPCRCR